MAWERCTKKYGISGQVAEEMSTHDTKAVDGLLKDPGIQHDKKWEKGVTIENVVSKV